MSQKYLNQLQLQLFGVEFLKLLLRIRRARNMSCHRNEIVSDDFSFAESIAFIMD